MERHPYLNLPRLLLWVALLFAITVMLLTNAPERAEYRNAVFVSARAPYAHGSE